jgi:signal transduction histidine kinase
MSFQARLTLGLVAGSVLPLAGFGLVLLGTEIARTGQLDSTLIRVVVFVLAAAIIVAVLFAYFVAANLTAPLRGRPSGGADVGRGSLGPRRGRRGRRGWLRLVESHNRLAGVLERPEQELGRILLAIGETSPRDGLERLVAQATRSAREAFEMIDARIILGDPTMVPVEEDIPGESRPVRAVLALPDERLGLLVGHLPATRRWDAADQDLIELYASEVAVAIRNLELFDQVERQRRTLVELDAAKDEFLRGISHNLQTPLTSIRAYADQLEQDDRTPPLDHRGAADRPYRIVRQLVSVSRLEAGTPRAKTEVLAVGAAGSACLGCPGCLERGVRADRRRGRLASPSPIRSADQVLWALLDNAARYAGERRSAPT